MLHKSNASDIRKISFVLKFRSYENDISLNFGEINPVKWDFGDIILSEIKSCTKVCSNIQRARNRQVTFCKYAILMSRNLTY